MTFCKEIPSKTLQLTDRQRITLPCGFSLLLHILVLLLFFPFLITSPLPIIPLLNDNISVELTVDTEQTPINTPQPTPVTTQTPIPPATPPKALSQEETEVKATELDIKDIPEPPHQPPSPVAKQRLTALPISEKPARISHSTSRSTPVQAVSDLSLPTISAAAPIAAKKHKAPPSPPLNYGQTISIWFKKHRLYNDLGDHDAILRIRLHRSGALLTYRFESATGDERLDQQIIDTLKSAAPFPPIPAHYSTAQEEEFLLPINTLY